MLAAFGQHLHREFRHEDGCSPLAVEGLILETLAEAERSVGTNDASGKPAWLLRALDFINDRFTEPLRLSSGRGRWMCTPPTWRARSGSCIPALSERTSPGCAFSAPG